MKYIIDLSENRDVCISDGQQTKIIQPDKNEMVVFNACEAILRMGFIVKLTPYEEHDTAEQAWELARHLYNGVSSDVIEAIYWSMNGGKGLGVAFEMPYAEAKAKYDAWQEEINKIKAGDEVERDDGTAVFVVTSRDEIGMYKGFTNTGDVLGGYQVHKTGRTFPEIADLLEKMRNPDADH